MEQRTTEDSSSRSVETINSGDTNDRASDASETVDTTKSEDTSWLITEPPEEHRPLDVDSLGRITTPVHPDFIVDWSNKDNPKAIRKSSAE